MGLFNMKRYIIILLLLVNYCISEQCAKYLIITPDNFSQAIQPLADWKTKKGIQAKVVPLSVAGNSASQIRNYITNAYNNWEIRPEYVLLVGMGNIMPYSGVSDDFYADMTGTGNPRIELSVGRFPCRTSQECSEIVAKTLNYERTPFLIDSFWFKKGTTIVNEDGYGTSDTIYWRNARYIHNLWRNNGFIQIDSFSRFRGDSIDDVITAIDNGRAFIIYRGSTVFNWWQPFEIDPESTNNGYKLPMIVSGTCATMSLIDPGYLGERFVSAGSSSNPKGSVGFFGTTVAASLDGLANLRGVVTTGFFHAIFEDGIYKMGDATKRAKFILDSIHPFNYSDVRYREWNLLGDPELPLWTDTPKQLTVIHDTLITSEPQNFSVTALNLGNPVANALVCVMKDSTVYKCGYTDSAGFISFLIYPQESGVMSVTVTARNCKPFESNVTINTSSSVHDVGIRTIIEPQNVVGTLTSIIPKVLIKNYGNYSENFPVTLKIGNIYNNTIISATLNAGDTTTLSFPNWNTVLGNYSVTTYTSLANDQWRFNDTLTRTVSVIVPNDVGVDTIYNPDYLHSISGTTIPKARVRNYGSLNQSDFPVVCSIIGINRILRYANTQVIYLAASRDTIINFASWFPTVVETCNVKVTSGLAGDENPLNNSKVQTTLIIEEYYQDFEESNGNFIAAPLSSAWQWGIPTSGPNFAHSGTRCWATVLNGSYGNNADWRLTSVVLTANGANPTLRFWHWYEIEDYYDGGNVRISLDSGVSWTRISPVDGYPAFNYTIAESCFSGVQLDWGEAVFNLPVVSGQRFLIQWRFRSDQYEFAAGWYIDDITGDNITGLFPRANDVGIDSIIRPIASQSVNVISYPIVMIRNYGIIGQGNFPVTCSIFGSGALRYSDTKIISLAAQRETTVYFTQWYPTITEICTVKMRTGLTNDENPANDRKTTQCEVLMLLLTEGFEYAFPPYEWNVYNNDSGTQFWVRGGTSTHSGTGSAENRFESSTLRNDDWLVTPMIGILTSRAQLRFWYRAHSASYVESLQVKLSTTDNSINSFTVLLDDFNFSNAEYIERIVPINGYGGQNVYIAFINKGLYRRKVYIDDIMIKGFTESIAEDILANKSFITMLYPLKPNPIKYGSAGISFSLAEPSRTALKIYDASGRLIRTLVDEFKTSGVYRVNWNCRDDYDREVAEGIYFYSLETPKQNYTNKLIVIK